MHMLRELPVRRFFSGREGFSPSSRRGSTPTPIGGGIVRCFTCVPPRPLALAPCQLAALKKPCRDCAENGQPRQMSTQHCFPHLSLPQRRSAIAAAELMSVTRLTIPVRRLLRIICAITSRKT
jgi:hypothetical protein